LKISAARALLILASLNVACAAVFVAPFWFPDRDETRGVYTINRHWDAPAHLLVAQSFYDPAAPVMRRMAANPAFDPRLTASELIAYPATVRAVSWATGWPWAPATANLVLSTLCFWFVYRVFRDSGLVSLPLACCVAFMVFPPRWLIYHVMPASEPIYLIGALGSYHCFQRRRYVAAGAFGALAAVSRIFGVLLFVSYLCAIAWDWIEARREARSDAGAAPLRPAMLALLLIPAALVLQFAVFRWRLGSWFAYFSAPTPRVDWIPFALFRAPADLAQINGLYGHLPILIAMLYGLFRLWALRRRTAFFLCLFQLAPTFFTTLPDLGRFWIVCYPFLLFMPYDEIWRRREAFWAVGLAAPLIFLYGWHSVFSNLCPTGLLLTLLP
jgi:hypothetical protein